MLIAAGLWELSSGIRDLDNTGADLSKEFRGLLLDRLYRLDARRIGVGHSGGDSAGLAVSRKGSQFFGYLFPPPARKPLRATFSERCTDSFSQPSLQFKDGCDAVFYGPDLSNIG
jgi:hypothetical protein